MLFLTSFFQHCFDYIVIQHSSGLLLQTLQLEIHQIHQLEIQQIHHCSGCTVIQHSSGAVLLSSFFQHCSDYIVIQHSSGLLLQTHQQEILQTHQLEIQQILHRDCSGCSWILDSFVPDLLAAH